MTQKTTLQSTVHETFVSKSMSESKRKIKKQRISNLNNYLNNKKTNFLIIYQRWTAKLHECSVLKPTSLREKTKGLVINNQEQVSKLEKPPHLFQAADNQKP